ncbi:PREDICTED: uncharacterized protein LOC108568996 [Nicrophorus vespilloides]|uniref:Uncharacterized protein LOC108568996 n=1 Tax=Nicrophorus vespilloides TaxID=110193 RepID=A0ABM1NGA2_NICVS|nr:PREDICTED: uncharacterized protein LOC108568996 [Nicrophorus vespilloides]
MVGSCEKGDNIGGIKALRKHPGPHISLANIPSETVSKTCKMESKFFIFTLMFIGALSASPVYKHESQMEGRSLSEGQETNATSPIKDNSMDGYLVPVKGNEEPTALSTFVPKTKARIFITTIALALLVIATEMAVAIITKVAIYTLAAFSVLALSSVIFSILCTFSSVCVNFRLWWSGLPSDEAKRSTESLDNAERFVKSSIRKYRVHSSNKGYTY